MGGLESVITGFTDEFRNLCSRHRFSREIFMAVIMLISFAISILNLTEVSSCQMQELTQDLADAAHHCLLLFIGRPVHVALVRQLLCWSLPVVLGSV